MPETPTSYPVSYWVNRQEHIALVRINPITVQGWQIKGRELAGEYDHRHFQTVYPSPERLEEYLKKFEPSDEETFLRFQFAHYQLDDYFREKANRYRDAIYAEKYGVPKAQNPPPPPSKS